MSGVLAVVTAGVYIGTRSLELSHAGARLRTLAFWQASEFLLQCLLFLLVGLQLTNLVEGIGERGWSTWPSRRLSSRWS